MRLLQGCISLALALFMCACATGNGAGRLETSVLPAPDLLTTVADQPDYRLGPNDLLNVVVFQVQDLERDVRVDNAGHISLPLIGTVSAAGSTAMELQARIEAAYRSRFLQDPQVSVFVKEYARRRITVDGAV